MYAYLNYSVTDKIATTKSSLIKLQYHLSKLFLGAPNILRRRTILVVYYPENNS